MQHDQRRLQIRHVRRGQAVRGLRNRAVDERLHVDDGLRYLAHGPQNVASRAYEDATETARFVASDGVRVKCFAVAGITIDQAEMIAAAALDWMALDEVQGARAVALALGPTV